MAKNKKGAQWQEKREKNKGDIRSQKYDFGFYATEYKKLLGKKYFILLDNGEKLVISFSEGNFYHFLGFHKFENTVFYSMINDDTIDYTQQNFFEDVYNGNIWYEGLDYDKIEIPDKFKESTLVHNFKEHELTDKTRHTLTDRFPFFTYDNIIKILKNKIVIDYEEEHSNFKVRASKILFYFLSEKNRNLNMFADGEKECFVTSFYLESKRDIYKYKDDGSPMNTFDVLCLYIEDVQNHQAVEFSPDWVMARRLVGEGCEKYDEMKKVLKKGQICTKLLRNELEKIVEKISVTKIELDKLIEKEKILELEYLYCVSMDNKDEYILKLMDYDIDAESLSLNEKELKKLVEKNKNELLTSNNLINKLQDKKQKVSITIPEIECLDMNVLKRVYLPLLENSQYWKKEFWEYFIHNYEYQRENIPPRQLRNIYINWRDGLVK